MLVTEADGPTSTPGCWFCHILTPSRIFAYWHIICCGHDAFNVELSKDNESPTLISEPAIITVLLLTHEQID